MCTSFCLLFPSYSRFLPVWHFQSAQYPLTEYLLTFGWLDTFSRGREFIINLHLISPLYLKHFLEETKKKSHRSKWQSARVSSSLLDSTSYMNVWERNPFWQVTETQNPILWRVELLSLPFLGFRGFFFSQVSNLTVHKEIGHLMWVNKLCDGVSFNLPYSSFRLFHFLYPCVPLYVTI